MVYQGDTVAVLLGRSQIDGVFVLDCLQLVYFLLQVFVFLLIPEVVTFLDEGFADLVLFHLKHAEWKLRAPHFVDYSVGAEHRSGIYKI